MFICGAPGGGYPQRKVVVAKQQKTNQEAPKRTEPDSTGARGYIIDRSNTQRSKQNVANRSGFNPTYFLIVGFKPNLLFIQNSNL